MRLVSHIANPLTWLLFFSFAQPAMSMPPQTGIYWNRAHPGRALYLENQNGTIFAVLYGYSNLDSGPEFYVSSGGIIPSVPADFIPPVDEFYGNLGGMPPRSAAVLRSSQRVIGRRISD